MLTLSYGYQKPQTGDRGTALFTALENNIQKVNDHTHNGTDSAPIDTKSIQGVLQNLSSSNWVSYGGPAGFYRQLVMMPAGFLFDTVQFGFRLSGKVIMLEVEKVGVNTYYVYSVDNTISPTVIYGA